MIQRLNSATTGTLAVMVKLGNIYNLQIQQFVYKNYKICTCWGRERISRYPGCNIPILTILKVWLWRSRPNLESLRKNCQK